MAIYLSEWAHQITRTMVQTHMTNIYIPVDPIALCIPFHDDSISKCPSTGGRDQGTRGSAVSPACPCAHYCRSVFVVRGRTGQFARIEVHPGNGQLMFYIYRSCRFSTVLLALHENRNEKNAHAPMGRYFRCSFSS